MPEDQVERQSPPAVAPPRNCHGDPQGKAHRAEPQEDEGIGEHLTVQKQQVAHSHNHQQGRQAEPPRSAWRRLGGASRGSRR